jgi:serine phosphatase RsbU (regulator of sigma subunit)
MKSITIILLFISCFSIASNLENEKLDSLIQSLKLAETDSLKCETYYELGKYQFFTIRDLAGASDNLFSALKIAEQQNFLELEALCYDALMWMEDRKSNHFKAVQYARKSCDYYRKSDKRTYVFKADYNLGCMLLEADKVDESEKYLIRALKYARKEDVKNWELNCLMVLGSIYKSKNDLDKALKYTLESSEVMFQKSGNYGNGRIPSNLAVIYSELGNIERSNYWIDQAIKHAKKKNDKLLFKEIYFTDFELKKKHGKSVEALESYEKFVLYKDSIFNEQVLEASDIAEDKYKNEIEELENSKIKAEKMLAESEQKRAKNQQFWMIVVVIIVLIGFGVMAQRFVVTKKQKIVIEQQKEIVEEKNKEITDSIQYAKRIQNAILPPDKLVKKHLQESFILYKPKDIVAGDFYWLEHKDDKVLFAAADCTGHGVPGAMVSVVCNNGLNRSVREYGLTDPGEILNKTREIVIAEFEKSDEEVKDGMDIALCNIEGTTLKYAGANNPLWIIRDGELRETKADKQPIGKFDELLPYTTHTFELQKGDSIYIFSDGYVDQFGGEKGKKFKAQAFRELLLSIQNKPMEEQRQIINTTFENWKGGLEQIDDVCIIGVKI